MLPIVLVFLFAQSALCLPTVDVDFIDFSEATIIHNTGEVINRNVTVGAIGILDGGEMCFYSHLLEPVIHDLASSRDAASKAAAAALIISVMGEMGTGVPGDACQPAALINTSVSDRGRLKAAVTSYIQQRFSQYIDIIVGLVIDPNGVRYSSGPRGNCLGGGRTYKFEEVWDGILDNCNAHQFALFNEEYCAVRRLYTAFDVRSNNLAAAVTAATIPEVLQVFKIDFVLNSVSNLLRVVANGGNPVRAAQAAKAALLRSVSVK